MLAIIHILLAFCGVAVTAITTNDDKLFGGSPTTIEKYPEIAALLYNTGGNTLSFRCGSIIINSRSLLTTASCVNDMAPDNWHVRVGSTWANSGGIVYNISNIIVHPNFNKRTIDSDLAVLHTTSEIFLYNARPASFASSNYKLGDNQGVWTAGWGSNSNNGAISEQLHDVKIWTVNQKVCQSRYFGQGTITQNMLCAGWLDVGGRDQCTGDSGSPLYHNGTVVGVTSWGKGCGQAYFPGVNVRVSRFYSWIQENSQVLL